MEALGGESLLGAPIEQRLHRLESGYGGQQGLPAGVVAEDPRHMELLSRNRFSLHFGGFQLINFLFYNARFSSLRIREAVGVSTLTYLLAMHLMFTAIKAFEVVAFFRICGLQVPQSTLIHVWI